MEYNITYRQKDKGWQVIVSYKDDTGKWKQKSKQGFKTKKDAKPYADELIEQLKTKENLHTPIEYKSITFKEFSKLHMQHLKINLEANTYNGYSTALLRFKDLNELKMTEITPTHIQNIVDTLVNVIAQSTLKLYLRRIHTFFNAAIEKYKIIIENPVKNIRFKSTIKRPDRRALTSKESSELLEKLSTKNVTYYIITLLLLECGLRIGEAIGLTWDDIDFKNRTISINKQWKIINKNKYGSGTTKSKNSNRIVPMSRNVYNSLKNYNVRNLDGRIFKYKNTNSISGDLKKFYSKLGFQITVHELRHTYATKLISNGIDFKTAAKILGHDVEQTIKTYSHVTDEMLNNAFELLQNF
ncbi:site-specific integrase [Clostridium cadaveris]|uniref:site-specific integrase n=1 Tax=Clostridium cadaveris TaxID=1529 RepID=UPI0003FC4FD8|nr:site-specific integrase [Clostridium cadaveris]